MFSARQIFDKISSLALESLNNTVKLIKNDKTNDKTIEKISYKMSAIELMNSFNTSLIKPNFIDNFINKIEFKGIKELSDKGVGEAWFKVPIAGGAKNLDDKNNKIINQNIRLKELSKLKKLYKKLNKK